ncbi:MAG TPA: NAD(P)/FAD-dependent oxidoreductase [Nitrospira sp.]|nr:NAD(P)/FAD-dependent oxidoreductase [Nitrospira sp.]
MRLHPTDEAPDSTEPWDAVIVGGGLAGLSAAVYLGRSQRRTLLVDAGESMARWEPAVENYLGFPEGLSGPELLDRGRRQAEKFGVHTRSDRIQRLKRDRDAFLVKGSSTHRSRRVLLATGLTHLLPDIPGADLCLGRSVLFCKDCDAYRVRGKRVAIYGRRNEAARYALAMMAFSPAVAILTDGHHSAWDQSWQQALEEYSVPVLHEPVQALLHRAGTLEAVLFRDRGRWAAEALFATRGDVYHTALAEGLGAAQDDEGQLIVDGDMRTTVAGLYAAGCVTSANCQMIIAAGQGATAAQAIERDHFDESLRRHGLRRSQGLYSEVERTLN